MTKGMWYILAAAVVVYLLLRPRRGMVGKTKMPTSTTTDGVGAQIGTIVDGVFKVGKELFKSGIVMGEDTGTSPPDLSGLMVGPGERADFI